jgi:hypothetical protein
MRIVIRQTLVVLCSAALLVAMPATSGLTKGSKGVSASVTGGGTVLLTVGSPAPFSTGDRLHISLTARAFPHGRACSTERPCGQFLIVDQRASGLLVLRLKGNVTCANFSGHVANVTGIVKSGVTTPRTTSVLGRTVAITVNDNAGPGSADLVGLASSVFGGAPPSSGACPGVPANLTVTQGEFTVHSMTT